MKKLIISLLAACAVFTASSRRYAGGDISLLPAYEEAGAKYLTHDGQPIADLIPWLHDQGMNAMRIRLFVNPEKYKERHLNDQNPDTRYDPNACQDFDYILPLCKKIVSNGMDLMLDFHYSDTWADPAKQWTPIDWEGLTDEKLYQKIYDYTKQTLLDLKTQGVVPAFIQPGNEISYGMLWGPVGTSDPKKTMMGSDANWERLGNLLKRAVKACREVCPDAKIVLHTERVQQPDVQRDFYSRMRSMDVDYDIIGLSYYPYWHGTLDVLDASLSSLGQYFPDKEIMIVETGYCYKWVVPGSNFDHSSIWPLSDAGQNKYAHDLVSDLERYSDVNGLFWWWLEYNAYGTSIQYWYNAPLFDSTTGRACSALTTICSFADGSAVEEIVSDNMAESGRGKLFDSSWYDLSGRRYQTQPRTPGLYIHNRRKYILR